MEIWKQLRPFRQAGNNGNLECLSGRICCSSKSVNVENSEENLKEYSKYILNFEKKICIIINKW